MELQHSPPAKPKLTHLFVDRLLARVRLARQDYKRRWRFASGRIFYAEDLRVLFARAWRASFRRHAELHLRPGIEPQVAMVAAQYGAGAGLIFTLDVRAHVKFLQWGGKSHPCIIGGS